MSKNCGKCGCGSHVNCSSQKINEEKLEKMIKEKSEHNRKYTVFSGSNTTSTTYISSPRIS
jgi:hypothetical protein